MNDGKDFEKVTVATAVNKAEKTGFNKLKKKQKKKEKDKEDCDTVYIVPRNDDILVRGTFIELNKWTTDLTVVSTHHADHAGEVREVHACFKECALGS